MARLTTAQRNALPDSAFAGPGRTYPINDAAHARNAQSRAAQFASPALKAKIAKKVHAKFPKIGKSSDRVKAIQAIEATREGESPKVERKEQVGGLRDPADLGATQLRGASPAMRGGHPLAEPRALGSQNPRTGSVPPLRGGHPIPDPRRAGA
jgi:hypothetical protein